MDIIQAIGEHQAVMAGLSALAPDVDRVAGAMAERLRDGGTVYWFGNGGSATQAQHFSAELLGRYEARERRGFRSMALTADTTVITSVANDYSYDAVFARQVEGLCRPADVVVGLSTSGNSPNVLMGIDAANRIGTLTVGMSGRDGGKLARAVELPLVVDHQRTPRIQEAHLFLGHTLCELIEIALTDGDDVRST